MLEYRLINQRFSQVDKTKNYQSQLLQPIQLGERTNRERIEPKAQFVVSQK